MTGKESGGSSDERPNPRKRPYAELCTRPPRRPHHRSLHLDAERTFVQTPSESPSESLNRNFPPPATLHRYEGDGLDLRRPIMSEQRQHFQSRYNRLQSQHTTSPSNFIDLTSETDAPISRPHISRNPAETSIGWPSGAETQVILPARTPEVIDLEDNEDDDDDDDVVLQQVVTRLPEVEFLSEQPRRDRPQEAAGFFSWFPRHTPWLGEGTGNFPGLLSGTHLTDLQNYAHAFINRVPRDQARSNIYDFLEDDDIDIPTPPRTDWGRAGAMDFTQVAFDLGEHQDAARPRSTTRYEAPPTPPEGFTSTMQEDDIAVCPNCGHELGTGDSTIQKQIYVIRKCGHVYCGQCATPPKSKKRPFSKCIVNGCGNTTKLTKQSMFMLYI